MSKILLKEDRLLLSNLIKIKDKKATLTLLFFVESLTRYIIIIGYFYIRK